MTTYRLTYEMPPSRDEHEGFIDAEDAGQARKNWLPNSIVRTVRPATPEEIENLEE